MFFLTSQACLLSPVLFGKLHAEGQRYLTGRSAIDLDFGT